MDDTNKPARTLDELKPTERRSALRYFRAAIAARRRQWDLESKIEKLLNRDVEFDIENFACCGGDPTFADMRAQIEEAQ